ncbi:hypothetical protein GQ457_08G032020 [Hibiscus cannabinus]
MDPSNPWITPRVAPTPTWPRTTVFTVFHTYWDTLSFVAHTVNSPISDLLDRPHEDRHWRIDTLVQFYLFVCVYLSFCPSVTGDMCLCD